MPIAEALNPTLDRLIPLKEQMFPRDQKLLNLECGCVGPTNAKIAIIGEAPGKEEQIEGTPFIGQSGQLLDRMLAAQSIRREDIYITNVVKERPFNNDLSHFIHFTDKGPVQTPAFDSYLKLLSLEIDQLSPDCILVPMGKVALYALTGEWSIMNWRGSIVEGPDGHKIIPTIHPAACLEHREPLYRYYVLHDLERVKDELKIEGIVRPERELMIKPDFSEATQYLFSLFEPSINTVAFDIEVLNQEVCCISFSHDPSYAMTIAFCDNDDLYTDEEELELMLLIAELLEDPDIPKVAHNAIFDSTFMFEHYGIRCQNLHCSMVAHFLINPDFSHSLAFLTSWYTREPYYKDQGKEIIDGLKWDASQFWDYCAKDSACCLEAWLIMVHQLHELGNWETYLNQVAIIPLLTYMQVRGVNLNPSAVSEMERQTQARMDELHSELETVIGRELPKTFPNSNKQLTEYFKKECKIEPYRSKDAPYGYTFNKVALSRLARRDFREAAIIAKIKAEKKMMGSYIKMKLDPDKRARGCWKPTVRTGRFACTQIWRGGKNKTERKKRMTGVAMQTLPHLFKVNLEVDDGYVMFGPDLSQAEARIVAWLACCRQMKEAFKTGKDVHVMTASLIFGIPESEVSDEPGSAAMGGGAHSQRYWGKQSNHKLNYNNGYKAFALKHEITERDGKAIVEGYHSTYPEIRQVFHEEIRQELNANHQMLTNCYGRTRRFQVRMEGANLEAGYAQKPQSTVADKIIRDGLLHMFHNELYQPCELLNQVHDSIVFQVPVNIGWEHISEILKGLTYSLERPIQIKGDDLIIPCDMSMGLNMGELNEITDLSPTSLEQRYTQLKESKHDR